MQDPAVTQVTEPPPSSGPDEYNPFAEGGKPAKKAEPEVGNGEGRGREGGGKGEGGEQDNWVEVGLDMSMRVRQKFVIMYMDMFV